MKLSDHFPQSGCVVLNLRGTNGSGKTTTIEHLIKKLGVKRVLDHKAENRFGIQLNKKVAIVGKYTRNCKYAGCDGIRSGQQFIKDRIVELASKNKIILFEGAIVSHLFSGYVELSKRLKEDGNSFVWLFLDTPLLTCLNRILERRKSAGKPPPVMKSARKDQILNTVLRILKEHGIKYREEYPLNCIRDFEAILNARKKAIASKESVADLRHNDAPERLYRAVKTVLSR